MADAFEILSDCPVCKVEAAVVELVDPGRASGVAVTARCRLCLREERLGRLVHEGSVPRDLDAARAALLRWASEEGESDLERFCEGSMGVGADEVARRLVGGEPVSTNFDALAWLFGGMSGGGAEAPARAPTEAPAQVEAVIAAPAPIPFRPARALASVLLADGRARPAERALADRMLERAGYPPIQAEDMRVWRPSELGRPSEPGPWIEALIRLVWADGQRDESEWRVLREIARAWAWPMARLERMDARQAARHAPLQVRAWQSFKRLFVSESP